FHYGFVWYRGHFSGVGNQSAVTITARQCYSVYLNGALLGSATENLSDPPHVYALARTFVIPSGLVRRGQDNVIAILTESLGHDEGWVAGPAAQTPQGLIQVRLGGDSAIAWRLQGDQGGEHPSDTTRGIFNASGLYG